MLKYATEGQVSVFNLSQKKHRPVKYIFHSLILRVFDSMVGNLIITFKEKLQNVACQIMCSYAIKILSFYLLGWCQRNDIYTI